MGEEFLESEVMFPEKDDGTTTDPDRCTEDDDDGGDETSMIVIRSNGQQMQDDHHHHNLGLDSYLANIKKSKSSISRSLPVIIPAAAADQYDQTKVRCHNDNCHYNHDDIYESDDYHFYDQKEIINMVCATSTHHHAVDVVPPHLIVARRIAAKSASSLLAQSGRPLRGKDLCQVRNSILRLTGFLQT